jgi:hypothetical protein
MKTLPVIERVGEPVAHGSVSKMVKDSHAVSFGRSSVFGYCWEGCRLHDGCYAGKLERIRTALRAKLERVASFHPVTVAEAALHEMPRRFSWFRLCVHGSVPRRQDFASRGEWLRFVAAVVRLCREALKSGADVHFPLESPAKCRTWRAAFRAAGLPVVVRRSVQSDEAGLIRAKDPRSFVVVADGQTIHAGGVRREQVAQNRAEAVAMAERVRASGSSCVVCPFGSRPESLKCGQCTACSDSRVDVVLYPLHG